MALSIPERLTQAQSTQKQIEAQIDAYNAEIQRLAPQLWAIRGQVALLIELNQETPNEVPHPDSVVAVANPDAGQQPDPDG
jgi:septal ring factor EnvC (AmiA/AmiB activator)